MVDAWSELFILLFYSLMPSQLLMVKNKVSRTALFFATDTIIHITICTPYFISLITLRSDLAKLILQLFAQPGRKGEKPTGYKFLRLSRYIWNIITEYIFSLS